MFEILEGEERQVGHKETELRGWRVAACWENCKIMYKNGFWNLGVVWG